MVTHLTCTPLSLQEHNNLSVTDEDWYCSKCLSEIFPFITTIAMMLNLILPCLINNLLVVNNSFFESVCLIPFLEEPDTYQLLHNSDLNFNMFTANSNLLLKCC